MNKPDYFPELILENLTALAHSWGQRYPVIEAVSLHKTELEDHAYLFEFKTQDGINKNTNEFQKLKKFLPLGRFFPSMQDGRKLLQAYTRAKAKGFHDDRIEHEERCAANNYLAQFLVKKPGWVLKNAQRANITVNDVYWKLFKRKPDETTDRYSLKEMGDHWVIEMGTETASITPNGEAFDYFLFLVQQTGAVAYKQFILHFDGEYPQEILGEDDLHIKDTTSASNAFFDSNKIKEDIWECQQAVITQSMVDDHNKPIHKNKVWSLVKQQLEDAYNIQINCKWDSNDQQFSYLRPKKVTEIYHEAVYQKLYQVLTSDLSNVPSGIKRYFENKIELKTASVVFNEVPGKWAIMRNE